MPVVAALEKRARVPVPLGAALVLTLVVGGTAIGVVSLHDQALDMLDKLPQAAQKLESAIRHARIGAIAKLKNAANEIDKAAASAAAPQPGQQPAPHPPPPAPRVSAYLWSGSVALAGGLLEAAVVVALSYFLLLSGDMFRRKLVRITGETFGEKRMTVQILEEVDHQIQRYLFVQVVAGLLVGLLSWLALAAIGLDNAAFWGVAAGVLHLVPYVGPTVAIALTGIVSFLQFPDPVPVMLVLGSLLLIVGAIGFGLMPLLTARLGKINAVTVFIALLAWGWLWGVWGLLLGVPIVMVIQAVCERIPELQPLAELLGSERRHPPDAEQLSRGVGEADY
jgi:predicted PurR-regulated permease PerM